MQNFIKLIKDMKLQPKECITWYYGMAIFTLVPFKAFTIFHDKLVQDQGLTLRTKLAIQHIIDLLGFYLHNISTFQGKNYEQVERAAMDYPVSPIIANIHMEYYEDRTLRTTEPTKDMENNM